MIAIRAKITPSHSHDGAMRLIGAAEICAMGGTGSEETAYGEVATGVDWVGFAVTAALITDSTGTTA